MRFTSRARPGSRAGPLIAVILVIASLSLAQRVLIPIALAILVTFVLSPLTTRVQHVVRSRVPAALVVVAFSLLVLTGIGWLVAAQAGELGSELPRYRENIMRKARSIRTSLGGSIAPVSQTISEISREITSRPATQPSTASRDSAGALPGSAANGQAPAQSDTSRFITGLIEQLGGDVRSRPPSAEAADPQPVPVTIKEDGNRLLHILGSVVAPLVDSITNIGIAAVFVVLLLIQREELRDRLISLFGRNHHSLTIEVLDDAARRVSRYLVVLVCLNTLHGVVIAAGLFALGVPGALLWGFLAALLRFIPFVGTWIAAAMPTILSLAVFDGWTRALLVVGLFLLVDIIINSLIEPWLYGVHTGATPVAILVSTVFWTWLWGGVGLFLATPLTVCLVVMARHIPQLKFLDMLLGDRPALPPHERLYHRFLAGDEPGVGDLVRHALKDKPLPEVCDSLIIPALCELEHDQSRHADDGHRDAFVRRTLLRLADEAVEQARAGEPAENLLASTQAERAPADAEPRAVCLPARGWIDELTAQMLVRVLAVAGIPARTGSTRVLTSELIDGFREQKPQAVCICAMPGSPWSRVRYLCKRLNGNLPDLAVVAAVWRANGVGESGARQVTLDPGVRSVTRMVEVPEVVRESMFHAQA